MSRWHLFRFSVFSVLFLCSSAMVSIPAPCSGENMIIIVPYKSDGTAVQRNTAWNTVAEQYRVYKESTGLETQVFTLDFINTAYAHEGVDEPERVKRLIYNRVRFAFL